MIGQVVVGLLVGLGAAVLLRGRRSLAGRCRALEQTRRELERRVQEMERERHELQASAERLVQADRYRGAFLAAMGHEFRTPLNAILGFAEVLQDGSVGALNERQAKYASNIHLSGRHLLRLVNEVLDLSKIEAGQMRLACGRFPIERMIQEAETILRGLADRKGVGLTLDLSEIPPGQTLVGDEQRMKEVLLNLIANAIRFTPAGGQVSVRARILSERLHVEVVDTGIGISREDQERIFEAFQQVDPTRARERRGTGLGLALARRFIELHHGRIGVQSELNRGSTFWFDLPLARSEGEDGGRARRADEGAGNGAPASVAGAATRGLAVLPQEQAPQDQASSASSRRAGAAPSPSAGSSPRPLVLIAEDDPRSAELLGLCLRRAGFTTVYAADGVEALAKARALLPSVISLDLLLPSEDGWGVLRILRSESGLADIPVVVVSAMDQRERGLRAGAREYLVKPIDPERIAEVFSADELRRPPGHDVRVLVGARDPDMVLSLRTTLEMGGFVVDTRPSPGEAVRSALAVPTDLLVLVVTNASPGDARTLRTLRDDPAGRAIPVIGLLDDAPGEATHGALRELADQWLFATSVDGPALVEDAARLIGRRAVIKHGDHA